MPAVQPPSKVLVTGANGYIAVWLVKSLLEKGYAVRGTVRSADKAKQVADILTGYGEKLELVVVEDITKEGAFDEVVKDVDAIEHTASPFHFNAEDPQELIGPAIQGTVGVLKSASQYGKSVKRIVVTSSCASVLTPGLPEPKVFTESDWNEHAIKLVEEKGKDAPNSEKYRASKTLAEKAAWKFYEENKSSVKWDLVTLCPPFVFGPALHHVAAAESLNTSADAFYQSVVMPDYGGKSLDALRAPMSSWVDVRDAALSHVLAIEKEAAGGERLIVASGPFCWQDFIDTANALSPHPMPSKEGILPQGAPGQGKDTVHMVRYDTSKAQRILGIAPKGMEETTRDTLADYESRGW